MMNLERRQVVAAMQSMGWQATKKDQAWRFSRPDTGGLWDCVTTSQQNLSFQWLRQHDPQFQEIVANLWADYYPTRFAKTMKDKAP